jgi:hypothetical protein
LPFLGYFFNDPTKSSSIGEKSPNLVTLDRGERARERKITELKRDRQTERYRKS